MIRPQTSIRTLILATLMAVGLSACMGDTSSTSSMQSSANTLLPMPADASGSQVPEGVAQFAVDPFWPQPLPNNWILG